MNCLKIVLLAFFAFSITGCLEEFNNIELKEDGSGTFVSTVDMSTLIEMAEAMGNGEDIDKEVMDTTIQMQALAEADTTQSEEMKELLKNGELHLMMNTEEKIFKFTTTIPFSNAQQLQLLLSGAVSINATEGVFKNILGGKSDEPPTGVEQAPAMPDLNSVYDVKVENGKISRKVNMERYNALKQNPEVSQMQQLAATGMSMTSSIVFKLPAPAKKVDNTLLQVSDDKLTVGIRYNMLEILDGPEKFEYTIEY